MTDQHDHRQEIQAQAERYVELGVHELAGMSAADLHAAAASLATATVVTAAASPAPAPDDQPDGRIPWLLVIGGLDPADLMPLTRVRGRAGYVDMNPSTPDRFTPTGDVDLPSSPIYLVRDFDAGDSLRDVPPSEAMVAIKRAGREPLTIDEAVCALVLHPDLLATKHAFSILASRSADRPVARSVPAVWVSRGAPRLGWCWNDNPHTWLGSGSCAGRVAG